MRSRHAIATLAATTLMLVPLGGFAVTIGARAAGAAAVPGVPRAVSAVQFGEGGSGAAKIGWLVPTSDGGSAITGYVVTPYKAGVAQSAVVLASVKTTAVLRGLQNGKPYRFKVAASNAVGAGAGSAASVAMTVGAPGMQIIRSVHKTKQALPGWLQVDLKPEVRGTNRVAPILRVDGTCTSSNGGATKSGFKKQDPNNVSHWVYVGGLTIGKTYKCTVTATDKYGTGLRSKPSVAVIA
jgi:Fibronectin type III domain